MISLIRLTGYRNVCIFSSAIYPILQLEKNPYSNSGFLFRKQLFNIPQSAKVLEINPSTSAELSVVNRPNITEGILQA